METKVKKKKHFKWIYFGIFLEVVVIFGGIMAFAAGIYLTNEIMKKAPQIDIGDFQTRQSSFIYDADDQIIAEVANYKRVNIDYEDLPNCLVDAFVATEDSRFFRHPGFDIARFSKAILENIRSLSFAQGGSTFTMQLLKNTYYTDDATGKLPTKSIDRKVQEIFLSLELEKNISKKDILKNYLNRLYFGGVGNIRGVEKASLYYFGKSVTELNLPEAALLAGVINAPNAYDPHNDLEASTARRDEVLYLMHRHGYISDTEYAIAQSVKVEDLLRSSAKHAKTGEGIPYQAYIDEVIREVDRLIGLDPVNTSMRIYTNMNQDMQGMMDDIQAGKVGKSFTYPDERMEIASIMINNHTGAIVAILGGRNYCNGGALLLNHATDQYNQPGSSVKPMLDYALAFEKLGWSTSHAILDIPLNLGGYEVGNYDNRYLGQITLYRAVGLSRNTSAIRTLLEVVNQESTAFVVDYMHKLGFDFATTENFNAQFAIGGSVFNVSCKDLASAQTAILNDGVRVIPHTVRRIEFDSGREPFIPKKEEIECLSPQSAYLTTKLLYNNVEQRYGYMDVLDDNYPVYAKTGTTDWGNYGKKAYGFPIGATKDKWMLTSTADFTFATWTGYDEYLRGKKTYISQRTYDMNINGKVANMLLDKSTKVFGIPGEVAMPNNIGTITHIIGTFPYQAPIPGMDEKYITSGYVNTLSGVGVIDPILPTPAELNGEISLNYTDSFNRTVSVAWPAYPNPDDLVVAPNAWVYLNEKGEKVSYGKRLFDYSWLHGPIRYKADVKVNGEAVETVVSELPEAQINYEPRPGDTIEICGYYGYENSTINPHVSNLSCKAFTADDRLTIIKVPAQDATKEEVIRWADENSINLHERTSAADAEHPADTIMITRNNNDVTGRLLTLQKSEVIYWSTWEVTYYLDGIAPDTEQTPNTD